MTFLKNAWYAASWSSSLGAEPMERTITSEFVVLYRRADGTPVALEDRCCHRALPLSLGRIEGDDIRCGYHGLRFAPTGVCVEVPGQSTIPPGAEVRSYPVVERWNTVWIWMGEAAAASGIVLGAAYMLWLYQRTMFGAVDNPKNENLPDLNLREWATFTPLLILAVWIGLYPKPFLDRLETSVDRVMTRVSSVYPPRNVLNDESQEAAELPELDGDVPDVIGIPVRGGGR